MVKRQRLATLFGLLFLFGGASMDSSSAATTQHIEPVKGNIVPLALVHPSVEGAIIEHRRVAILMADWMFCDNVTGALFIVPKGYMTDFASIPAGIPFFQPFGLHSEAAIAHDWLYAIGETGKREWADKFFLAKMQALDVSVLDREAMYAAVRIGGEAAYGRADEWLKRFGNPATGERMPPKFEKPKSAMVADGVDCNDLRDPQKANILLESMDRRPGRDQGNNSSRSI